MASPGLALSGVLPVALLLSLGRLGPLLLATPFLGWLGRLGLLGGGTALLAPLLLPTVAQRLAATPSVEPWQLGPLLLHELGVGGLLLLGATIPLAGLQMAGRLLGLEPVLARDPHRSGPLETLFETLALGLIFSIGGGPLLVAALGHSYGVAPIPQVGEALSGAGLAQVGLVVTRLLVLALVLALPLLVARLLAALAVSLAQRSLGLGGRALGSSLATLVALVTVAVGLAGLLSTWQTHVRAVPRLFFP